MLGAVIDIQERLHGAPARAPEKLDADPAWGEDGQLPEVFRFLAPPEPPQTAAPPKRAGFGGGFGHDGCCRRGNGRRRRRLWEGFWCASTSGLPTAGFGATGSCGPSGTCR